MKKIFIFLLIGIFMVSFSSSALDDNIISYYKLDNTTGVVFDMLELNDGTNSGATRGVVGIINNSFDFSLGAFNVDFGNVPDFDFGTADFSVSVWVNLTAANAGEVIIGKTNGGGASSSYGWGLFMHSFGGLSNVVPQMIFSTSGTHAQVIGNDVAFTTGSWVHIVAVVDRDNASNSKIYIDDVSTGTTTNAISTNTGAIGNSANSKIGSQGDDLGSSFLNGGTDEIGIWNRALSSDEVSQLFNEGLGNTYPFTGDQIIVTLDSPIDEEIVSGNVTFNVTLTPPSNFNLTNATIFIWDSDGDLFFSDTNIVLGNESNTTTFTVTNLTSGGYEWNIFGSSENSTGFLIANFSSSNNTFIWVPFSVDSEEFNSNIFETSRQSFLLNISTLPSVLSVDAILNYNGTRFTADTTCSSGLCQISTDIDIPLVSIGESENKSFFWEISVFDGTNSFSTNLTSNEQNVTRLHLEKCDGTYTVQTLNFTSFDEETEEEINPFMFDGSFDFWLGTGTVKRNNSISESSISSLQLCLTPATETLFLDGTVEYDEATGTNYTKRNYFFQDDQINNISEDIQLGLLLAENSVSFILRVQDRDILPVADVLIFTERFYPGEGIFRTVQVSQTDDNGRTIGFFETETVEYRFILKQNGVTVLTTNKQKIVGDSVPFTLTFTIGDDEGAAWETFEPIEDLVSDISFNKTSSIVSFTYLDTSGNFQLSRLIVEKVNASGLQNTIVCSKTSVQSSATITCNLTGNSTGHYIMRGIITRDGVATLVEQESFEIEDFSTIAGRLGLFLGFFIILISVFAFKFNEVAGIILVNIAMIFVNMMGLINFGYVFISAMVAISIIILVVLER